MRVESGDPMKDFHCRDMDLNCEFVAKGETGREVIEQTERHLEEAHHRPVTPELEQRLNWLIHDQTSSAHRESVARNS
jgi:predicted small metal-binding protein